VGLVTGDSGNELLPVVLDNNVHIAEYKVATCDIRPGRRPRGRARLELVEDYRRRAGIEEQMAGAHVRRPRSAHVPTGRAAHARPGTNE
jgi:formate dehydrogenase major subunit